MAPELDLYGTWRGSVEDTLIRLEEKEEFRLLLSTAVRDGKVSDLYMQTGRPVMRSHHGKMVALTKPLNRSVLENVMRWATKTRALRTATAFPSSVASVSI